MVLWFNAVIMCYICRCRVYWYLLPEGYKVLNVDVWSLVQSGLSKYIRYRERRYVCILLGIWSIELVAWQEDACYGRVWQGHADT